MQERIKQLSASFVGWLRINYIFGIVVTVLLILAAFSLAYAFMNGRGLVQGSANAGQLSSNLPDHHEKLQLITDSDSDSSGRVNGDSTEQLPSRARACENDTDNTTGCETSSEAQPESKPTPCEEKQKNLNSHFVDVHGC